MTDTVTGTEIWMAPADREENGLNAGLTGTETCDTNHVNPKPGTATTLKGLQQNR